ncbi:MAG: transketolase [Deltaproteobacteria bacterium]|nr:transketolase [Deltaproteobacteria bacterium]
MSEITADLRKLAANTLRALAIDAVNQADSGHPGAPMGLADIAVVLFGEILRYDPSRPDWLDRDRFVLSNGHASMLLYGALHLSGYGLSLDDLKHFRQLKSKTPGHPEFGHTPGVETTTGPLGQGFANAVGFALGARMMKARFNGKGFSPFSHRVYGILGDGCMMEGVASEAASIAGHLGLGELVFLYDDNGITIDGQTNITFTEDVEKRFLAYGWHTLRVDGHDQLAVKQAIREAEKIEDRPSLILAKTHIGYGSPNRQDKSKAHGEPLGPDEGKLAKEKLGWTGAPFEVPAEVRAFFGKQAAAGKVAREAWEKNLAAWKLEQPELAKLWDGHFARKPGGAWKTALAALQGAKGATRAMSGTAINALAKEIPGLVGGSADLAGSTKNTIAGSGHVGPSDFTGRNLHFGVREHGMASIVNGLALYGGFVPFGATFLAFADYNRPALRLSALMKIRALEIFTHDSIGLGEDGPTHQPVEQLWALRVIPGYHVWRPADGVETAMAWAYAAEEGAPAPHALVFTRQNVAALTRPEGFDPQLVWKGGYVLQDAPGAQAVLIATGSEVGLAVAVAAKLAAAGKPVRVVSMPCLERFLAQDSAYQASVLPPGSKRCSIEAGRTGPWKMLTGLDGLNLGVDTFGESAPYEQVYDHFGLSPDKVVASVEGWLARG